VIGTSPLGTEVALNFVTSQLGRLVSILLSYLIFFGAIYTHVYCYRRIEALGYSKKDFFRFFIPVYGIYFAYQFASKLSSAENLEIPSSPKSGKGLNF
jgi:hypothetical protein